MKSQNNNLDFEQEIKKDLIFKGLAIPVIFAIITAIVMLVLSNPNLNIFPSGNHHDEETTVSTVTQSEYMGWGGAENDG